MTTPPPIHFFLIAFSKGVRFSTLNFKREKSVKEYGGKGAGLTRTVSGADQVYQTLKTDNTCHANTIRDPDTLETSQSRGENVVMSEF